MKPFAFGNLAESLCEHCLVSYAPAGDTECDENSQNKVRPSFFRDEILQPIYSFVQNIRRHSHQFRGR